MEKEMRQKVAQALKAIRPLLRGPGGVEALSFLMGYAFGCGFTIEEADRLRVVMWRYLGHSPKRVLTKGLTNDC